MPRTLILIRHAKSGWDNPVADDHARRLSDRGRRDAPRIGRWLAGHAPPPDLVLCSDASRTAETWSLIAPAYDTAPRTMFHAALYNASLATLQDFVDRTTAEVVAIVGHNPGIGDLANRYGASGNPRFAEYPTGAVSVFDLTGPRPVLTDFVTPHDLPD